MSSVTTKSRGDAAETQALAFLRHQGLQLVQRNYRVARGPGARAGEIDLVMLAEDKTLVFVEVRLRSGQAHGGAAASIDWRKQQRCVWAARHFLREWLARGKAMPPCRFDVISLDNSGDPVWIQGAFDAHGCV